MTNTHTYRDALDTSAEAVRAAHTWTHPDYTLSPDDLAAERRTRVAAATAARTEALDRARSDVFPAAARALTGLAERYAAPPIGDAAQIADRRNRWERIAMLADRGESIGNLIAGASRADLDAIAEWAPTWVRAEQLDRDGGDLARSYEPNPVAWVQDLIAGRYAALDPTGPAARAVAKVRDALDVAITLDYHDPIGLSYAREQLDTMSDGEALATYRTDGRVATQTEYAGDADASVFMDASAGQGAGSMGAGQ